MTYEEAKEIVHFKSFLGGPEQREAMNMAYIALDKTEKNQWHSLKKNPNDLPKTSGFGSVPCLILREYSSIPEYAEYEFFEGYGWGFYGIDNKSIKAWKYFELEQLEE